MNVTSIPSVTHRMAQGGLQRIVDGLAQQPEVALARIWVTRPDADCDICLRRSSPAGGERGLHLTASAGRSRRRNRPESWTKLDGQSHCFPLQSQKIGRIGATGEPLIVRQAADDGSLTNPHWLKQEGIRSFFGYPLVDSGMVFGVMAVFSRREFSETDADYLRLIADGGARLLSDAQVIAQQESRLGRLAQEHQQLLVEFDLDRPWDALIAHGPASQRWRDQIELACQHQRPVLLTGEHGSGKEFSARLIHASQPQPRGVFLKVNCSSLTTNWLNDLSRSSDSSQHEAGGTLLLDGLEQTPLEVQSYLADFVRASASRFALRIVATSSRNLPAAIEARQLSQELFCALSIVDIGVPPLRHRREDLSGLVQRIVETICRKEHRPVPTVPAAELEHLGRHAWPGNVRELQRAVESAIWNVDGDSLNFNVLELSTGPKRDQTAGASFFPADELRRSERKNLLACLKQCHWKVYGRGGAAEALGMKPTTLQYRMRILGIRKPTR